MITTLLLPDDGPVVEDRLTRRELIGGGLALAGLAAAGCADLAAPEPAAPATRTFTDDLGVAVEVPQRPRRIVSTWSYGGAVLLEAGAPVAGMPLSAEPLFDEDMKRRHDLGDVTDVWSADAIDLEQVAALSPDLVVVAAFAGESVLDAAVVDRLREIAPVVHLENFQSLETLSDRVRELVGDFAALPQRRLEFEGALEDLRAVLAVPDLSLAFLLHFAPDGLYTYGPRQLPAVDVLTRAGARWLPIVAEAESNGGDLQLSLERVADLNADVIIAYHLGDADITALEVFAGLPANGADQVVVLPETHQAITWANYTALAVQLTKLLSDISPIDPGVVDEDAA